MDRILAENQVPVDPVALELFELVGAMQEGTWLEASDPLFVAVRTKALGWLRMKRSFW